MRNIITLFSLFLLFSSCSSFFKIELLIDNSSDKEMVLVLDGKKHRIDPNSSKRITIVKGEHEIIANLEGEDLYNNTISITQDGILNLMESTYIIHKEIYAEDPSKREEYLKELDLFEEIMINGKTYQNVDFTVFEGDVFIPKNWNYNVDENLPSEIDNPGEEYVFVSKVYRILDLESIWGFQKTTFDFSDKSDEDLLIFMDSIQSNLTDTLTDDSIVIE